MPPSLYCVCQREKNNNEDPTAAKKVSLICQLPSMKKMEPTLNILTSCEHLSLSSNAIDRIAPLPGLKQLKILSLGRNQIKKVEKLEDNASTLEELWLSYNQIDKLDGLTGMKRLRVLYLSNNTIKNFDELLKLRELPALEDILLVGNPCYDGLTKEQRRIEVNAQQKAAPQIIASHNTGNSRACKQRPCCLFLTYVSVWFCALRYRFVLRVGFR
jgi:dynein axonemal light chain 1